MAEKGRVLQTIIALSGKVDPALEKSMLGVQKKLDGLNVKALAVGAAIGTAVAAGTIKATKYMAELGDSYNTALNDLKAQTGATAEEMEAFADVMQGVYKAGYGETFGDVADGVAQISKMTDLAGKDLEDVTKSAFALAETFDYDVAESARAAKAMMTNFGIGGQEAMNLIAAGAQNGLDYSGELIDSINEYSVQFSKLGFTAEDMFKIYQAGADSGAWNLDKVGDAIKEFSIRSIDGSKTSIAAFETLGYNADEMFETFTKGGDEATGAFHEVINRLMDMEDHVARDAAGVGLFGTMWEDLGTDAMQALADMQAGAYATGEELSGLQAIKYDNIGAAFEQVKRTLEVALLPVASDIANRIVELAPKIQEMIEKVMPHITTLAETLGPILDTVVSLAVKGIGFLAENIEVIIPIVAGLTAALLVFKAISIATGIASAIAFSPVLVPILAVTAAIGALIAIGIALYRNWDVIKEKALDFGNKVSAVWDNISGAIKGMIDKVGQYFPIFGSYLTGWWDSISAAVENVKNIFRGVIDFVSNVFAGNWKGAWQNIIDIFGNIFGAITNMAKAPINGVISAINTVIEGINGVGFTIPDWVPVVGGKSYSIAIPEIPMLAAGGFTSGVSIAGEAGTEAVISFDPAYRSENLSYWAKAGQMLGAETADYNLGYGERSTSIDIGGVSFAPQITVQGNAHKEDIIQAIRAAYPEFLDMLEEWIDERGEYVYG